MIRILAAALAVSACAPTLPKLRSPQMCCKTMAEVARLDGKRVLLDGIYQANGIQTEGIGLVGMEPGPPEELAKYGGRHVVVMGRIRERGPAAWIDQIERIDLQ